MANNNITVGSKTVFSGAILVSNGKQLRQSNTSQSLVSDTGSLRSQPCRKAKKTRFDDNPVSSVNSIQARPDHDTSTRNRRGKFKLNVTDLDLLIHID